MMKRDNTCTKATECTGGPDRSRGRCIQGVCTFGPSAHSRLPPIPRCVFQSDLTWTLKSTVCYPPYSSFDVDGTQVCLNVDRDKLNCGGPNIGKALARPVERAS